MADFGAMLASGDASALLPLAFALGGMLTAAGAAVKLLQNGNRG